MKVIKYLFIALVVLIILAIVIASPFVIKMRSQGERMYQQYAGYTEEVLARNFQMKPAPVKAEFQKLHPWKFLKMFKIVVNSRSSARVARINSLDATMFLFMKMYTLMLRPDYGYNLPMLSVDLIFIGDRRVFVIEVIDPAKIEDENIKVHYEKMREWAPKVRGFEQTGLRDWYKDFVTDFSIHIKADKSNDEMLFDIYKAYLEAYVSMTKNAEPLTPEMSARVREGINTYVSTLLEKGGPAVEIFEKMLGKEGQQEYVRTVMFGLEK